ncbi:MAG: NAD-glutamate dehydrogenase domain-containing protein [bacterium]
MSSTAVESSVSHSFDSFCQKYSFYIPQSHKNFYSSEDLNLFLRARYDFFREHSEEVKIAVYNPGPEYLWLSNSSVIEILMPDSPFIVDTIVDYCNANNHNVQVIIHPILNVVRNERGELTALSFPDEPGEPESYIYLEINRLPESELRGLREKIAAHLQELRSVVTDYRQMLPVLDTLHFDSEFVAEELRWLKENFVLLGLVSLQQGELNGQRLGLFRKGTVRRGVSQELRDVSELNAHECIFYRETEIHSNINKYRQIYVAVVHNRWQTFVLAGHFRHRAQLAVRYSIPAIKRMIDNMAKQLRVPATSYMRKELYKAAQSLPVGLLLTRSQDLLLRWFVKLISNMYTADVTYDLSIDEAYNIVWAEIILPLADAGKIPGRRMKMFLKKYGVQKLYTFKYQLNQVETVFMGFRSRNHSLPALKALLEENAHDLFSTWSSRFRELVYANYVGHNVDERLTRFVNGMSPDYEMHQEPEEVLCDLETLEHLTPEDGYEVNYAYQRNSDADAIKIYSCTPARLSELVPILTDFGFTVDREYTFPYKPDAREKYTYMFTVPGDERLQKADRLRISEAIVAVLRRQTPSKPINELVRVAGLTARQLELVKALCGYYYKIETSHTFSSIQKCLVKHPQFVANLVRFFETKFGPAARERDMRAARLALGKSFHALDSVLEENICKAFLSIVNAIVRTNYFLGKPEISFKIKSSAIENMPPPAPYFEIYVYSYEMEGFHLRGGPVARGGIRWSDRQDDFRTEILGLLKAQMVKNTVIVPVGSKGGFVVKNRTFADRQAYLAAGIEAYKRYIACLLELTDNLAADGKVIPAPKIKRLDGDDTYLVVAADKGTARFSDIANEISTARQFWLTDAFASGGSNGYDHKKQGITAKGAWESVKRHFHEMEIDPERDEITVVGIGDMGGDVFGNGLLCSQSVRLLAAFNHLYVFVDPNPDTEKACQERVRLFGKCANWDEYNLELISKGGGVFNRASRHIDISPQMREALGIKARTLSGEGLIKAILRAPVGLLWNGGIGTYVKASHESHFHAGDPANDRVRIDACELRTKVVAEGGNLGLTQAARIEAASQGVRLNTDAIDNSGGVNMSDHEVNLKILLNSLLRKKIIDEKKRDQIIRTCEAQQVALVLAQNYKNNLGLSLDMLRTQSHFLYVRALIQFLNRQGILDRGQDSIPFEADLDRLEHSSRMLPRPVLCALLGFAKLYGTQLFIESDEFYDEWYDRFILRYFPSGLARKYRKEIQAHPLKREIVITEIINEITNHAGLTFFQRAVMATQKSPARIAAVYLRLSEFLHLNEMRAQIEASGEWLDAKLHYAYLLHLEEKVYQMTKKLLLNPTLLAALNEKDSARFRKMLSEATQHSSYRLPRKLRILCHALQPEAADRIMAAFKRMDILDDTFSIYLNNKISKHAWPVADYFSILQLYRIRELRQILKDLKASSNWEISFFSKVEDAIERLLASIIRARESDLNGTKQKIKGTVRDILEMHTRSELTIATLYEMVEYLNTRVVRDS